MPGSGKYIFHVPPVENNTGRVLLNC